MTIEIIDSSANEIQRITLDSNPFKVGQVIHLSVNVKDITIWRSTKNIQKSFMVNKIEHYVRVDYTSVGTVHENVTVSIEVSEIDEQT